MPVTVVSPHMIKNSARFVSFGFFNIMPADIMKPGFIIMTAYFLAKMKERYGSNIFSNKDAWRYDTWLSWIWYLLLFSLVIYIIFNHPDFGTAVLYLGVFSAIDGFYKSLKALENLSKEKKKDKPPISFTEHD